MKIVRYYGMICYIIFLHMDGHFVYILRRVFSLLLAFLFFSNQLFAQSFSNTNYSGTSYNGTIYSGTVLEPYDYYGIQIYPISYSGTVINGILYEGIDLSNIKITIHTITGNETSSTFFDKSVPEEYRVNWNKVIKKYAIGTTIIVITGIIAVAGYAASEATGGASATVGYIAAGMCKKATAWAFLGALTDGIIAGTLSALKGNPKEKVFKETIEASADGFMWGAITGAIYGGIQSAVLLKKFGKPCPGLSGRIKFAITDTGDVYKIGGGAPVGRVLPQARKNGLKTFFYDSKGQLYNFDGELVAKRFKETRGLIKNLENGKTLGYIDSKGILSIGNDIAPAIENDIRPLPFNINSKYKNSYHPETGVPYKEKIVRDTDNIQLKGVFPEFESVFDAQLPEELYLASDGKQFNECTRQLKEAIEKGRVKKKLFTTEQLEQIMNGDTPDGFTWHHNEELGIMQLVDSKTHEITRHTGGKVVWGGGKEYR